MLGRRNVPPTELGLEADRRPARAQGLPFRRRFVLYREVRRELPGIEAEPVPGLGAATTGNWGGRYWEPGRLPPGMGVGFVGQVGDPTIEFRP